MSALNRTAADAELVRQAEGHGCLTPTFTRESNSSAWSKWEQYAFVVIMGAAREADLGPLCAMANYWSGNDVPAPRIHYTPRHPNLEALITGVLAAVHH